MVREAYKKPEFNFQEMGLFERVADVCWGTTQVWLDANHNNKLEPTIDINFNTSGGCQGKWSADTMIEEVDKLNVALNAFNESETDYSILAQYKPALAGWAQDNGVEFIAPITSKPESKWANTKAKADGFIIISSTFKG